MYVLVFEPTVDEFAAQGEVDKGEAFLLADAGGVEGFGEGDDRLGFRVRMGIKSNCGLGRNVNLNRME